MASKPHTFRFDVWCYRTLQDVRRILLSYMAPVVTQTMPDHECKQMTDRNLAVTSQLWGELGRYGDQELPLWERSRGDFTEEA